MLKQNVQTNNTGRFSLDKRGFRGFSLTEILISLGLLATLVGYMGFNSVRQSEGQKVKMARMQAYKIARKVNHFYDKNNRFPRNLDEVSKNGAILNIVDPWGNKYQYRKPGQVNSEKSYGFDVYTHKIVDGRKGQKIGNWEKRRGEE